MLIGYKPDDDEKVRVYEYVGDFEYEGYSKTRAIKMLTRGGNENFALNLLDEDNRLLHHAVSQLFVPKTHKTNPANTHEIFYMWCIRSGLVLDVPFIILFHIKVFLENEFNNMPFGMIIRKIAKFLKVNFSGIASEKATTQASYGQNMMSHMKSKKVYDPAEKDLSDEKPPSKGQKRKPSASKAKGKGKRTTSPSRRSTKVAKESQKEGTKESIHINLTEIVDSSEEDPMEIDDMPKPTFDEDLSEYELEKDESSSLPKPNYSNPSFADNNEVNTDEVVKIAMNVGVGTSGAQKDIRRMRRNHYLWIRYLKELVER